MSEPVVIVQGGVHTSCVTDLKKKLAACGYTPKDPTFFVVLFCDWHEEWNGVPFGLDFKSGKESDFKATNIHCVNVHDPTPLHHWMEAELITFYDAVDAARDARAAGKKVISVCMKGEHRSKALQHALDPQPAHLPKCVSMQAAAKGWRDNRDMKIWPLGPERSSRSKTVRAEKPDKPFDILTHNMIEVEQRRAQKDALAQQRAEEHARRPRSPSPNLARARAAMDAKLAADATPKAEDAGAKKARTA
ncbi:MAG: hypothetical protein CMB11_04690 [Euryarchaeota archaeon]|nr:hypothetical protein [Euryarchaeota archaeon]